MKVLVVTTNECKWCDKVKELLTSKGITFTSYNIMDNELNRWLFVQAGFKTVPQVIIDGKLIGGYEATKEYLK